MKSGRTSIAITICDNEKLVVKGARQRIHVHIEGIHGTIF